MKVLIIVIFCVSSLLCKGQEFISICPIDSAIIVQNISLSKSPSFKWVDQKMVKVNSDAYILSLKFANKTIPYYYLYSFKLKIEYRDVFGEKVTTETYEFDGIIDPAGINTIEWYLNKNNAEDRELIELSKHAKHRYCITNLVTSNL